MMIQSALLVSFSLYLTYLGASRTLKGALGLSTLINLNRSATGAVVIASITALPELTSSVAATFMGSSHLAMGNILGSNIYNLPLLIGLAGLVGEFEITNHVAEQCLMLVVINLVVASTTIITGTVSTGLSVLLLGLYLLFLYRQLQKGEECEQETCSIRQATTTLVTGGVALILGSFILVNNAVGIMNTFNIKPFFVGVVMSLGAVLPEVAVSLFSAVKGEHEISVGNIVGDNVITITLVLGIVSLLRPVQVTTSEILTTIPFTIAFTAIIYMMHIKGWIVTRRRAILFLVSALLILVFQLVIV